MHRLALGLASLLALAIIAIGSLYVASPKTIMPNFGLPLPEMSPDLAWWLRLKGVRDIVSGLAVLAFMTWGDPRAVGLVLLVETLVPLGDMSIVLAGKGSAKTALGVHGVTAAVMLLAAIPLLTGA